MTANIEAMVRKWSDEGLTELSGVNRRLNHLERRLYKTYEPSMASREGYWERLEKWLESARSENHKQTLFKLAPEIFYVGPEEFNELYRCAYAGPIARWLIDQEQIDICDPDAQKKIRDAAAKTWFCPLSDSLRINSFYHVNDLAAGANLRPDWRSLAKLGSERRIRDYCQKNDIRRLVILEDFVGGGSQTSEALPFASSLSPDLSTLFVPLVICPSGAEYCRNLCLQTNALTFEPVIELPAAAFFNQTDSPFDKRFTDDLRNTVHATYKDVSGGVPAPQKPYGPYGYPPDAPVGGLIVMFSNTPDNSLPLLHWKPKTGSWNPLFPRHSRV